ncbi:hypothetical protein ABB37_00737 [Leptomonas pyrrhocoris]|uniref:Uncharacterized protein n=1 Tax=Leptomonas pyrrhocoris TaxID=157538 RepID=A0A0M9GAZ7_LEPPY|nr:hypothetical protein ABB37_00737 [Leptomonas pyrrhocoris]KPA86630.1 hypothetical protein ABB37_00737 [Leptomonas pyrrhocoris]|eukprot:XP_015665069.1 hypothetical protein ABB37_00737 [Leptomonas pyrrhocoris]
MSNAAKRLLKNVGVPFIGFGIGWGAFTAVEHYQLLGDVTQRWLNVHNLKLQMYTQRLLPASLVDKYGYPEETLKSMIELMEKGYTEAAVSDRMTFDEVLRQCAVPEQIAFLEEHASEEVPYFYIADIFHSWANLNVNSFAKAKDTEMTPSVAAEAAGRSTSAGASSASPLVMRNDADFDSDTLCHALYDKMLHNVIPFDVSIRALCVLAVNNKANAKRLARVCTPDEVVRLYAEYTARLKKTAADGSTSCDSDVVAPEEVTAATLFFLRAINDVSIHTRWVPLLGAPSTGPYPLARKVQPDQWCRAFGQLNASVSGRAAETALVLVDVMNKRLRCSELRKTERTEAEDVV